METFIVRVVTAGDEPILTGFIQHIGSRPGQRFQGSRELLSVIEACLEREAETPRPPGDDEHRTQEVSP